jgi:uncharacterized protein (TIGR02453 family)
MAQIEKSTIDFLKSLKLNNNRDWFNENKPTYQTAQENMAEVAEEILGMMKTHDEIETPSGKKALFRIYRDVRFSKNKEPYKTNFGAAYRRNQPIKRGGYYLHIEPGNSFVGGGFYQPNKDDLAKLRGAIAIDGDELKAIINAKSFTSTFDKLVGDQLKTAPKGYPKDHEHIDLLRHKGYLMMVNLSDEEILSPTLTKKVNEVFKAMRPVLDWMTDVLTHDENGEPLFPELI